jgi:hypothetical protein
LSIAETALKGVTYHNRCKTNPGYTLFSTYTHDVWLIDMEGDIVNRWRMPYTPGAHQWLLPNGNLLFAGMYRSHTDLGLPVEMAGIGGVVLEVDWNSNLVWKGMAPYQAHDICPMENGHVMYAAYHPDGIVPDELAAKVSGGRPGTEFEGKIWADVVREIDRDEKIVWEWKVYEHLDPRIDSMGRLDNRNIWGLVNSVWICRDGNVLMSLRNCGEAIKVEYRTGEVIARYGRGRIFHGHDARELADGTILMFDNGCQRHEYGPNYSRVVEIDPDRDEILWEYRAPNPADFYSCVCSGAERLSSGNTVICDSWHGRIFEVTRQGELVWEYVSPFVGSIVGMDTTMMWRAHRYEADYPGLRGKELDPRRFPRENRLFGSRVSRRRYQPLVV